MISIVIVNYHSEKHLIKCLYSIYKHSFKEDFEIIVVNNDQKDKIKELIQKFPEVKIYQNEKNLGFGAGNNVGARIAKGDILLFLNPDTEIISKNIEDVLSLFEQDDKVGIIGSQLRLDENKIQPWSVGYEISLLNLIKNNLGLMSSQDIWQAKEKVEVDWVSGAALFIRKDIFEKTSGFDEKFFMYFEDMDLCVRIKKLEKKVLYYPNFEVRHLGGESYQQKKLQKKDYYRSQEYYFKKNRNFFEWLLIKILAKLFYANH
ncbi:MAG: hypothetical protein A2271_03475 [Candidatus Moranbacteria bacterium RIFOXYA12_FULL_35_19]|nr:MAG: hypothetical protein A2489_03600 [Candidatus Moranbacteria bacterium RIFOXYC12_FULL_36_13]OGI36373.1 MAG: hypothetical protein A2271_03475 [Candidatus Moranbacteria bacterium RIFOXYA12_FULL_35_19]